MSAHKDSWDGVSYQQGMSMLNQQASFSKSLVKTTHDADINEKPNPRMVSPYSTIDGNINRDSLLTQFKDHGFTQTFGEYVLDKVFIGQEIEQNTAYEKLQKHSVTHKDYDMFQMGRLMSLLSGDTLAFTPLERFAFELSRILLFMDSVGCCGKAVGEVMC